MLQKINDSRIDLGFISTLYPGLAVSNNETGIGSIGQIDHPKASRNLLVPMHPHENDEILSYFRTGKCEHKDSEGFVENIGGKKLMLMKAGKRFYHEERISGEEEEFEGLQIFIRPGKKDMKPEVVFLNLEQMHSENQWRLLASPTGETTFRFSSQTWIYDMKLLAGYETTLPELVRENLTCLLYVFQGNATIKSENRADISLAKMESVVIKNEPIAITTDKDTELVLFVTDEQAEVFKDGMFSGNKIAFVRS
ncbi:MAG: pirin family protein [Chitinophagaceae bacterium]|nr:pirin family protein [Chitinophagaceae bacterium]